MIIKRLELADYRNYEFLDIQFDKGTNILYGDNAQGKTNILESIYVAATTKSHKSSKDKEIVNFNKEEAHIRTYLEKEGVETRVDMHLRKNKSKGIAIDGTKIKKSGRFAWALQCCVFLTGGSEYHKKRSCREKKICGYGTVPAGQLLSLQFESL